MDLVFLCDRELKKKTGASRFLDTLCLSLDMATLPSNQVLALQFNIYKSIKIDCMVNILSKSSKFDIFCIGAPHFNMCLNTFCFLQMI